MLNRATDPHELMNNSQIDQLIILVGENDDDYANQKTNTRDSLLHRAAYIGNIQLTLEIIYAGGELNCINSQNETALWIAIYNGHYLLADILVACGANKEAAEFYARSNKEKNQNKSQHTFWIANYERALCELKKIHVKSEIITAIILWQIKHQNKSRSSLFNLIKPQLYNNALDSNGVSSNLLLIEKMQNTLSQLSHLANQEAHDNLGKDIDRVITNKKAMISSCRIYNENSSQESVENIMKAYSENNFHDLLKLLKTDSASRIFSFLLLKNNHALTSFWIITSRQDLYELAPDMIYDSRYIHDIPQNGLLSNLFDFCRGNLGILIYIISDGMKNPMLSIAKLGLFKYFWQTDKEITLELFKQYFAAQYKIPEAINLEFVTQEKDCYVVNPMNNNVHQTLLAYKLNEFGIETSNLNILDNQQKLPFAPDILVLILSFFTTKELKDLSNQKIDPDLQRAIEKVNASYKDQNRDIYFQLLGLESIINHCFDELDNVYKKGYQSYKKKLSILTFIIILGQLALEIYNFIIYPPIRDSMRADLEKIKIPTPEHFSNCLAFFDSEEKWNYNKDSDFCSPYINDIQNLVGAHSLISIGAAFSSIILILNTIAIYSYFIHLRAGAPRANFQNQNINDYPKLKSSTAIMQNKLNEIKNSKSPIPGSHLIPDIKYESNDFFIVDLESQRDALENYRDHAIRICNDLQSNLGEVDEYKECKIEVVETNEKIDEKNENETLSRESELEIPLLSNVDVESKNDDSDRYRRSIFN